MGDKLPNRGASKLKDKFNKWNEIHSNLPGQNYLQLTPIEFQDRGLNRGPLEPVDLKLL